MRRQATLVTTATRVNTHPERMQWQVRGSSLHMKGHQITVSLVQLFRLRWEVPKVARGYINDQNEKKYQVSKFDISGYYITSTSRGLRILYVYRTFIWISGKKKYCTLIQTCYVHLLSTSVWNECLDRPHVVTLCVSAGQISGGSSTLLRGAYVSPTDDLKYNQVRPKPAQASTTALTSRVFTWFVWLQLLTAPRSLMFME